MIIYTDIILFTIFIIGFRLRTTVFATKIVPQKIDCVMECATEPCCRSINYKTLLSLNNETNCEMLHNMVYNTSQTLLEKNSSFDYVYLISPHKVVVVKRSVNLIYRTHDFMRYAMLLFFNQRRYRSQFTLELRRAGCSNNELLKDLKLRTKLVNNIIPRNLISLMNMVAENVNEFTEKNHMRLNPKTCKEIVINL